jgi:O-antigen biosynthesis protein
MKLYLKFKKSVRMVAQNGIFSGGKIVLEYLTTYVKSFWVGKGDILFVTGGVGDKAHYRAFGVAEELSLHGFRASVTLSDNFRLERFVDKFKIFVFHKISVDEKIAGFIAEIKKQNKEIIFETDDLDFDLKYLESMDYYSHISDSEKKEYIEGIGAEILNDPYVKVATTTVSYLADKLREKGKKVFVVSNKITRRELETANEIYANRKNQKNSDGFLRIGYYSGTMSHNKDFATVEEALREILEKNKKVKLLLAGPLETGSLLDRFKERIEILPRVSRQKYYGNLAKCDVNIAPLEIGNPFCEAKSEIKFIEAGILGIPTVAVRNRTYSEAISDGLDGFLASDKEKWIEKMSRLLKDEKLRVQMGEKAREKILENYTNQNSHSEEYYVFLREKLEK